MKTHPAGIVVLAATACVSLVACAAAQPQKTAATLKPAAVRCEAVTGSQVRRTKAAECGQSVRAYGTVTRDELERGSTAYKLRDGIN